MDGSQFSNRLLGKKLFTGIPLMKGKKSMLKPLPDELLKIYPGVSMVFRNPDDKGYPKNWVNSVLRD